MLTFGYPYLLLLLLLPFVLRWLLPTHHESRPAVGVPFMDRLARITDRRPEPGAAVLRKSVYQRIAMIVAWTAVVLALARPQYIEDPIVKTIPTRDLLLAVDLSGSMETEDFTDADGAAVDRLTAAKQVLDEFLIRREGDRVGLIFFGSAAFVQAPFTQDLDVCRTLLEEAQVRMAGPRTMLGDAIGLAIHVFENSQTQERVLILLTDGNDTGSQVPPAKAAEIAGDKGITIHTIAMGDPLSVGEDKFDEETLKIVAETTGGGFFPAQDRKELDEVYKRLDALETRKVETISHRPKRDLFQWPLAFFFVFGLCFHSAMLLVTAGRSAKIKMAGKPAAVVSALLLMYMFNIGATGPFGGDFHFLRPWWWLGLLPTVLIVRLIARRRDTLRFWKGVIDPHLLEHLLVAEEFRGTIRPLSLLAAALVLCVIALAGPSWQREPSPFTEDKAALFLVLKTTESMMTEDIQPTRLERAGHKIHDLLERRKGAKTGLIAYAGSAHLVMPLTRDIDIVDAFAAELAPEIMPAEGDVVAEAVSLAAGRMEKAGVSGSVLVLADGVDPEQIKALEEYRRNSATPVQWLAVVSEDANDGGMEQLKKASQASGGSLTAVAYDDRDLDRIVVRIETEMTSTVQPEGGTRWRDVGYWLIPLITLICLAWFRPGWVVAYD